MNSSDIRNNVSKHLRTWRLRLLLQRCWTMVAVATVLLAVTRMTDLPASYFAASLLALLLIAFIGLLWSKKWRALNPGNFALHLNRRLPAFEESAQLLLQEPEQLSVLQKLQRQRVVAVYADNLAKVEAWQTPLRYRNGSIIIVLALLVVIFTNQLKLLSQQLALPSGAVDSLSQTVADATIVSQIAITITPPVYTGMAARSSAQLDLDVPEGSQIEWSLKFSGKPANGYALELSDGQRIPLRAAQQDLWQAQMSAVSTDLYRLIAIYAEGSSTIGDIYALTVQLDQQPDIRIIEPSGSTLEIPKSGPAVFNSEVLISDDFGIEKVGILASVAKGSGEGVKFRDQKLEFQQSSEVEKGTVYQRRWDLTPLGMEPGDEVYFSILASDNKQPEPNVARSTTVIVRWLDEDRTGLAADGLAIDFIPEFFKSQRQIIIDTEQLIEDTPNLAGQAFKNTAYEIGHAQADLKQKYGQYLGDEFGEGPGEQIGPTQLDSSPAHDDDGHDENAHAENDGQARVGTPGSVAGAHAHSESAVSISNATNINDMVKLFGHDHGDPEIGIIGKQSPLALMKRAVSEMWSAEKHLMQAEPELALPFEYEAYKYLKLARQADRIYVKRLGFEPPPVTEERRLTGELDEIRSYRTSEHADLQALSQSRLTQMLLRKSWQLLSSQVPQAAIDAVQDEVLSQMSDQFRLLSQQRPALIKQAATLEKLRVAKLWQLNNCPDCLAELKHSIWNLMDDGDALLHYPGQVYDSHDEIIKAYQSELQTATGGEPSLQETASGKP